MVLFRYPSKLRRGEKNQKYNGGRGSGWGLVTSAEPLVKRHLCKSRAHTALGCISDGE